MPAPKRKKLADILDLELPPAPQRKNFDTEAEYEVHYSEWEAKCERLGDERGRQIEDIAAARKLDPALVEALRATGVEPPPAPDPLIHGKVLLTSYRDDLFWRRETGEMLCTPVVGVGSPTYPDRPGSPRTTRWRVVRRSGSVMVDIAPSAIHTAGGSKAIAELVAAGVDIAPGGRAFLLNVLGLPPAGGPIILDRPGWFTLADGRRVHLDAYGRKLAAPEGIEVELSERLRLTKAPSPPGATLADYVAGIAPIFTPFKDSKGEEVEAWAHQASVGFSLAGPVVALCDGMHNVPNVWGGYEGDPGICKTTCLELVASIWGDYRKNYGMHESLKQTSNALETPVLRCCGTAGGFDEMHNMLAKALQDFCYLWEDGALKGRSDRSGVRQTRMTFRGAGLMAGEHTLDDMLRKQGESRKAGLSRRYLPLAVDDLTPLLSEDDFKTVDKGYKRHCGTAGPHYVGHLWKHYGADPEPLAERIAKRGRTIIATNLAEGEKPSSVMARAAAMMAAVVVALEVAQDAHIIPASWSAARLETALWDCWAGSAALVNDPGQAILDNIGDALARGFGTTWMELDSWKVSGSLRELKAWRTRFRGQEVYVVRNAALLDLAGEAFTPVKTRRLLSDKGVLIKKKDADAQLTHDDFAGIGRVKGGFVVLLASTFDAPQEAPGRSPAGKPSPEAANDHADSALKAAS